jgi:exosortase
VAVGLTLLGLHHLSVVSCQQSVVAGPVSGFRFPLSAFLFPVLFFLVAVPWPTIIEGPLIQGLTRANAGATVELLGWFGIPALRQGNVIEVGTGLVGIDEACSGIRSFQSSLMISLFLGELYRLTVLRRGVLCLLGFTLAFLFNVGRTLILVTTAAQNGIASISEWHDPAGVSIMIACLVSLWLCSVLLRRKLEDRRSKIGAGSEMEDRRLKVAQADLPPPISHPRPLALSFLFWLLFAEVSVEAWYRVHEWRLPKSVAWTVEPPGEATGFREVPLPDKARQFLRYDEAISVAWREGDLLWQMIFLRWQPGRIAVHLAKGHTPEVCLCAAGKKLISSSELKWLRARDLELPFRAYVVEERGRLLYVFYRIWEERGERQDFKTERLTYGNRLAPVLAGRRNAGQRSLELAVWGIDAPQEAEAAVVRQLEKLILIEPKGGRLGKS